ncbi:alpha-hydroxy-acid oxidizing protein [Candidatus Puniceispirillum sp.]|nr:alpha-hydroxy-acid oxidizing protein [Candidatus Puniceispirillum sp.]
MTVIACVDDLQKMAKQRVPRMFYDYVDSGSWSESTYRSNESDLAAIKFRQRVAQNVSERTTEMLMLGQKLPMPVALAPTGLTGMQYDDGEILAARAASDFGVPFTLSTMSICSIEDVADDSPSPFWFQLYVMRDRNFMSRLIERARDAKCSALMVTLDLQILAQRHKDVRNGLSAPPKLTLRNILSLMQKPAWCLRMLSTKRRQFGNIVGHVEGVKDMSSLADWTVSQFDPTLSWSDIANIRKQWGGKLIIKGILDAEDALAAVNVGADAIVVSNHGGRQLDGAISSVEALPAVLDSVNGKAEVWMDSGIRSGQDVLRAIALGAQGTMIGRAFLYGLGAKGQAGVHQVLDIIHKELDLTLGLCGQSDLSKVDSSILIKE